MHLVTYQVLFRYRVRVKQVMQTIDCIQAQFYPHFSQPAVLWCDQGCFWGFVTVPQSHLQFPLCWYFLHSVSLTSCVCTGETESFTPSGSAVCSKILPPASVFMSSLVKHTSCHCLPVISSQCNALSKRFLRVSRRYKLRSRSDCFGEG